MTRGAESSPHNEAAALAPKRASLTLRIPAGAGVDLKVRIDGIEQPHEVWSNPMYIDAGEHQIAVEAAERQSWQGSVFVVDANKHVVVIPEFQPLPAAHDVRAEVRSPGTASELVTPASTVVTAQPILQHDSEGLTTQQYLGLGVGAAGVVALGASLAYTIAARSTYDDSEPHCSRMDVCTRRVPRCVTTRKRMPPGRRCSGSPAARR